MKNAAFLEQLGKTIRQYRRFLDLTQTDLAGDVGINPRLLSLNLPSLSLNDSRHSLMQSGHLTTS